MIKINWKVKLRYHKTSILYNNSKIKKINK